MPSGGLVGWETCARSRAICRPAFSAAAAAASFSARGARALRGRVAVGDAYACGWHASPAPVDLRRHRQERLRRAVRTGRAASCAAHVASSCATKRRPPTCARRRAPKRRATWIVDLLATRRARRLAGAAASGAPARLARACLCRCADARRCGHCLAQPRRHARCGALDRANLDPVRFAPALARGGLRPWSGSLGALTQGTTLVIGQSGTANEAAASQGSRSSRWTRGVPRDGWYRKRQSGLLGDPWRSSR